MTAPETQMELRTRSVGPWPMNTYVLVCPATHSTVPSGNSAHGASGCPSPLGTSGPAAHVPGEFVPDGVYSAVCPVPPM